MRPRWNKVLADLWGNKVRSALVVASVAVGLFAVGMIATIHAILTNDMRAGYAAVNPATITVASGNFDEDTVDLVKSVVGVQDAQGIRSFDIQALSYDNRWIRMNLKAIPDIDELKIKRVELEEGTWPPQDREIVIERNKREEFPAALGEWIEVQLSDGKVRRLKLVGVVHDETIGVSSMGGGFFMAPAQGYITMDTLEWLDHPDQYNILYATVGDRKNDTTYLREVANRISEEMEDNEILVYNAMVRASNDHPNASYAEAMSGVLFMLGGLVVFLSAFLITNTLSSLVNQQAPQIAVMKTVGARSFQIIGIYLALILVFGILALVFSLPLSQQGAFSMLEFLATKVNFNLLGYRTISTAVILQIVIAILVPQIAGAMPILQGAQVKVQEALSGSITEQDPEHGGWIDRKLADFTRRKRFGKTLSRPLLISLRNTFRRKTRLVLTLITLSLAGSIFIATFSVRASLESYITQLSRYFVADVNLNLERPYRIREIQRELAGVPGVAGAEGWAYGRSEILLENDQAGEAVQLLGPPSTTQLIEPMLISGRWVQPGDQNAIALSERFLSRFPDLKPGDTLWLRVNGKKTQWVVVGFFQLAGKSAGFIAYTNYEYLSELIHQPNRASTFRVTSQNKDMSTTEQRDLAARIESHLQGKGILVSESAAGKLLLENSADGLNTLTTFLLVMALLTALVGSIGLMGTMSMNVMDRTREIGVMRAIGASDHAVRNLVMVEGILIGFISWVLGVGVSIPISKVMSDVVTTAVFDAPARFTFTWTGPVYWLGLVLLLSVLASVIPARSAARITIREALAYE
jgi:putative ABC transport system permease protein